MKIYSGQYWFSDNVATAGTVGNYNRFQEDLKGNKGKDEQIGEAVGQSQAQRARARLITVEPVILLYYIAAQATLPIQQQYLYQRLIDDYKNESALDLFSGIAYERSSNQCGLAGDASDEVQNKAQAVSSMYSMAFGLATVAPALFTTVLLGSYSDRAGRKWAILPPALGDVVQTVICLAVVLFKLPLPLLIVGQLCEGITGTTSLIFSASMAYVADVTTKEERAKRIVIIDMILGVGNMAANVAVGHIIHSVGYFFSYVIIFVLNISNFIYIIFFLPETRERQEGVKLFSLTNYKKAVQVYTKKDSTPRRTILALGLLLMAFYILSDQANLVPLNLYLMRYPLCWNSIMIGYYQAANILVRYVMTFVLLQLLIKKLGESGLLILGCVSCILYDLVLSQTRVTWVAFVAPVAGFGMELVAAMIRAIASRTVSREEQGALFSGQGWISLFCGLTGTLVFNVIYAKTVIFQPRFVFYIAVLFFILLTFMSIVLHFVNKRMGLVQAEDDITVQTLEENGNPSPTDSSHKTRTKF